MSTVPHDRCAARCVLVILMIYFTRVTGMLKPDGRVVMISGANRGIGLAIAKTLAASGYQLSLGARQPDSIDTDSLNGEVIAHRWDAQNEATSVDWVEATRSHFGRIDGLVLNAGVMVPAGLVDGREDDMDLMWDVNFKGPLRLLRAALPALRDCGHGRVINVVSLSGVRVMGDGNLGYSASKFASTALTHAIRQNGWKDGIRATSVCPGLVDTDMISGISAPDDEFIIEADSIAETVAYALSLPDSAAVAEIRVNSRLESTF